MTDIQTDRFEFSGHPRALEWYRCYDDPTASDWIDGLELVEQHGKWDEQQKAKWHFFYRPFPPVVGRPQLKMIHERAADIEVSRQEVGWAQATIQAEESAISRQTRILGIASGVLLLAIGIAAVNGSWLVLPLLLGGGYGAFRHLQSRLARQRHIRTLRARIDDLEGVIRTKGAEILRLQEEIAALKRQIQQPVREDVVEGWLREEIAKLELKAISEIQGQQIDADSIGQFIKHQRVDDRVQALMIDSWGFLQPPSVHGPLGQEGTGRDRVRAALKERFATWRPGSKGQPLFRVFYLQHVFLFNRNIGVSSYFYDLISRERYGLRYEVFQYNHVTNFSVREIEIKSEPWVQQQVSATPARSLFEQEMFSAFTLAVASGSHFRCVLIDSNMTEGLNAWLKCVTEERELAQLMGRPDLEKLLAERKAGPGDEAWDRGKKQPLSKEEQAKSAEAAKERKQRVEEVISRFEQAAVAEVQEARKLLVEQRRRIEAIDRPKVQAVLQQIRESVENYRIPTVTVG